jgi:hypothetical protein
VVMALGCLAQKVRQSRNVHGLVLLGSVVSSSTNPARNTWSSLRTTSYGLRQRWTGGTNSCLGR